MYYSYTKVAVYYQIWLQPPYLKLPEVLWSLSCGCVCADHECKAVRPAPSSLYHHARRRGAGLWRDRQVRCGGVCPLSSMCCGPAFCACPHMSLIYHCLSVPGVSSVVLPYGRWPHAVLPQGRTTDRMLGVSASLCPWCCGGGGFHCFTVLSVLVCFSWSPMVSHSH